jgi:ABC-type transport system substrate-binding protein
VFFLRKNVRWHDGQPFTAKDVKYTFDVVREARDAPAKLRLSPRKDWYENVDVIDVARPMLGWRKEYFTQWPYVKNLVPHNALYNYGRMQEVWLDK